MVSILSRTRGVVCSERLSDRDNSISVVTAAAYVSITTRCDGCTSMFTLEDRYGSDLIGPCN